jgi:hypothetical protein
MIEYGGKHLRRKHLFKGMGKRSGFEISEFHAIVRELCDRAGHPDWPTKTNTVEELWQIGVITTRIMNCLINMGFERSIPLSELFYIDRDDIIWEPNFGRVSRLHLELLLRECGLRLMNNPFNDQKMLESNETIAAIARAQLATKAK